MTPNHQAIYRLAKGAGVLYERWRRRSDETIRLTLHPDHPNEIILPDSQTSEYLESLKTEEWQAMECLFERWKALDPETRTWLEGQADV